MLLKQLANIKASGRKPTPELYLILLRNTADYCKTRPPHGLGLAVAEGILRDAAAGHVDLGPRALEEMLTIATRYPEILPSLMAEVQRQREVNGGVMRALGVHAFGSLEQMLVVAGQALEHNLPLPRLQLEQVVFAACRFGNPRLALQLVQRCESMHGGLTASTKDWVQILTASADAQYVEGVEAAWNHTVANKAYAPDEGLLLAVLAVAGRWGRTDLATAALGQLPAIKVRPQEHHFAPLLEAMCNEGRVPEALRLVGKMRAAGVAPVLRTVQPLVKVLTSADVIDQAFYELEDMAAAGEAVDVSALNALIAASAAVGDLQRARATQLAAAQLGVTPDNDTFNLVLRACEPAAHRALGDTVLGELTAAGLQPDKHTYTALVMLCLTQVPFEDAFFYLEKMKASGFTPPRAVYIELAFKCVRANDKRWRLVVEEAQTLGYSMPPSFDRLREQKEKGTAGRARQPYAPRDAERRDDGQRAIGRDFASRRRADGPDAEQRAPREPREPRTEDAE